MDLSSEELIRALKKNGVTLEELKKHFPEPPKSETRQGINELQINHAVGTIYLHNEQDRTILRLTGLPAPIPQIEDISTRMLDIKFENGQVNWSVE